MTQDQRNKKAEQLRLAAQIIETGCEWEVKDITAWGPPGTELDPIRAIFGNYPIRIKEPEIPVPEGYRELRDDEKDGRWIEGAKYLENDGSWESPGIGCYAVKVCRIIVPLTKPRVPLEPSDVPPGSVVRSKSHSKALWTLIVCVNRDGFAYSNRHGEIVSIGWSDALEILEIKRPTDTEWQPCSKPAP